MKQKASFFKLIIFLTMKNIFIILAGILCSLHLNSSSYSSYQIGESTFYNGTVNGQNFSGSSYQIGNSTFYNGSIGNDSFNGSSYSIGNSTFYNFSE